MAALTPADIVRIAETEGPQAADAALQRLVRAREAGEAEAPTDVDLLGDLEVGADEFDPKMIEVLGDLDVFGEGAAIDEITKEKADPAAAKKTASPNAGTTLSAGCAPRPGSGHINASPRAARQLVQLAPSE
jgi:hypothetical protein